MRLRWSIAVGLAVAVSCIYLQVRSHEFLSYDDVSYLAELSEDIDAATLRNTFTRPLVGSWTPVTWISLLIDRQLHGREAAGYLLTNAALYALSAVLLFFALARMTGAV